VIITDQPGLFTADHADRRQNQASDGGQYPAGAVEAAGGSVSRLGVGGFHTKLPPTWPAARAPSGHRQAGERMLLRLAQDEPIGTLHSPGTHLESRDGISWQAGAYRACWWSARQRKRYARQLLPVGLVRLSGEFNAATRCASGRRRKQIARGLVNYRAAILAHPRPAVQAIGHPGICLRR
jgi:glutamate 5-kinase